MIYDYIILGEITLKHSDIRSLIRLIKCASYFMLDELSAECTQKLTSYFSDYTCLEFYLISRSFGLRYLKDMIMNYMVFRNIALINDPKITKNAFNKNREGIKIDKFHE